MAALDWTTPRVLRRGHLSLQWVPRQLIAVSLLLTALAVLVLLAMGTGRISLGLLQVLDIVF